MIKTIQSRFLILLVVYVCAPLQVHATGGGTNGGGGGGALVCFSESTDQALIDNLKIAEPPTKDGWVTDMYRASTMYKIIPDSMLGNIISVESLELGQAKRLASTRMAQGFPNSIIHCSCRILILL